MSQHLPNPRRLLHWTLLKSFKAYQRWSNSDYGQWGYAPWKDSPKHVREDRMRELARCQPVEYPCFATTEVVDMHMEQREPFYLYKAELQDMLAQIDGVKP